LENVTILSLQEVDGVEERFALPEGAFPSCHGATVCSLSSGELVTCCYAGSREGSPDSVVVGSVLYPGSRRWSTPRVWVNVVGRPPANPRLFVGPDGALWLLVGISYGRWCSGHTYLFTKRSYDKARSWTDLELFVPYRGLLGRARPFHLGDIWIVPVEWERNWSAAFIRSDDGGNTWKIIGDLGRAAGAKLIQPVIVMLKDGSLLAYMRSQSGHIFVSRSHDLGNSWSVPESTALPNNNSGIDVLCLSNGLLALAYNPVSIHNNYVFVPRDERWPDPLPVGFEKWGPRTPLVVDFSSDEGSSWRWRILLETGKGEYSYPYMTEGADGCLHIVYTFNRSGIKHVSIPITAISKICGI